jgi:3-deoxy-7-phosphoheptulonate synthase
MSSVSRPPAQDTDWSPSSWRGRPIQQQFIYANPEAVQTALARIRALPPLVFSGEIESLRSQLARAATGQAFVLHGGDCAERFERCDRGTIVRKLKILLQMSLVLTHALRRPVIRLGRMAGQFAKPRSSDEETRDGVTLPTYRGDLVNDLAFTAEARAPNPQRLVESYSHGAAVLNFIRALLDGGFADLHHPDHWQLAFLKTSSERDRFQTIADRIVDAIDFFEHLGGVQSNVLQRVEFFTSHEGLHMPYEEAFTVTPPRRSTAYNLGAHFLWIGDRTRSLDSAHVEYFRGITNPIGVKVGPSCTQDDLRRLVEVLNPHGTPGRLTLITRYGAEGIDAHLPQHIETVKATGVPVVWMCDPMHGNIFKAKSGLKTRRFESILTELERAFSIHDSASSHLGGVHFELTGDDVTECVGGAQGLGESDLGRSYETGCDPRLNYAQSLEMAFKIADLVRG